MSWVNMMGNKDNKVQDMHIATIQLRATLRLLVLCKILSLIIPPKVSPTTPAKNTLDAKSAEVEIFKL